MTGNPLDEMTPEHLSFDSMLHPASERFERYRQLYSGGADARLDGDDFRARMQGWRLDRIMMYNRRLNHVVHERGSGRVNRDAFDHFTLTLVLSGDFAADSGDGFQAIEPGNAVLLDMRRPMRNRSRHAHIVTISFPRDRVQTAAGGRDGLHGQILDGNRIGLLGDYVRSLIARMDDLTREMIGPATTALASLLSMALAEVSAPVSGVPISRDERIARVRRLVDQHFMDAAFGPETVVFLSGMSRATLYRIFQPQGGLGAFIQRRRLQAVRMALADPADARSFAHIVTDAGFASEAHCSRLFRETFGVRPSQYRATILASQEDPDPGRRLLSWQDDIR